MEDQSSVGANPSSAQLAKRIQRLEDIEEIRLLRFHYHHYVNQRQFEKIADLYTEDAVLKTSTGMTSIGRDAVRESFLNWPGRDALLKQYPHNHMVEVDGDAASGVSYFEARYALDGNALMVAGCYEETYARVDGRWLISSMTLNLDFAVPPSVGWGGPRLNYMAPE